MRWEIFWLAKRLLVSQGDLFAIELVTRDVFSKDPVAGIPVPAKGRNKCWTNNSDVKQRELSCPTRTCCVFPQISWERSYQHGKSLIGSVDKWMQSFYFVVASGMLERGRIKVLRVVSSDISRKKIFIATALVYFGLGNINSQLGRIVLRY
jgi:hypothetical protein